MKKTLFIMAAVLVNTTFADNSVSHLQNLAVSSGRDDVVYLAPATEAYEALPLGNGNLGVMVGNRPGMNYSFCNGSFFASADQSELLISSGELSIALPDEWLKGFSEERLNLYDGTVITTFKTDSGEVRISSWITEGRDLLIIEIESTGVIPDLNLSLSTPKRPKGLDAKASADDGGIALATCGLSGERATAVLVSTLEQRNNLKVSSDGGKTSMLIPSDSRKKLVLFCANPVVAGKNAAVGEALAEANRLVVAARSDVLENMRKAHDEYWHLFWNKSKIILHSSDGLADYAENLYNLHLYWMAGMARGPEAPKFNGGNYLFRDDWRSWGGCYWYQNTREMYFPLLASDHSELWPSFIDLYWRNIPAAQKIARDVFDCDGACFNETMGRDGGFGASGADKSIHPYINLYLTTSTEMAHQMYSYYLYTGDETFLKEKVYPLLKETISYHLNFLNKENDGLYHVYPSNARETYWWVKDSITDLSALRATLPILIEISRKLSRDEKKREEWIKILANLAPFPIDKETDTYAPGTFLDNFPVTRFSCSEKIYSPEKRTTKSNKKSFNYENVVCEPIYPWGLIGTDSSPEDLARMRKTFQTRPFKGWGFSNAWDLSAVWAVRLGLTSDAQRLIYNYANNIQMFPNGMGGTPGARPAEWGKILGDSPGFDTSGVMATLVQEMLLFSGSGKIRVFPALPKGWRGEFTLAAEGGFLVSSSVNDNGEVVEISVLSRRGENCVIVNPWKTGSIMKSKKGEDQKFSGDISFRTVAGQIYVISPAEPVAESAPFNLSRSTGPKWPVHISETDTAEAYLDRSNKFGFIGITADGRNPARKKIPEALKATK